jgi:hypothetical protein
MDKDLLKFIVQNLRNSIQTENERNDLESILMCLGRYPKSWRYEAHPLEYLGIPTELHVTTTQEFPAFLDIYVIN